MHKSPRQAPTPVHVERYLTKTSPPKDELYYRATLFAFRGRKMEFCGFSRVTWDSYPASVAYKNIRPPHFLVEIFKSFLPR